MKRKVFYIIIVLIYLMPLMQLGAQEAVQQQQDGINIPFIDITVQEPQNNQEVALSLQILLLLAVLTLSPSIIILMTSFLRIAVVLDFIRRALSLQQVPPTML